MRDTVDDIIRYETGEMSDEEVVEFFQDLVDTGKINHLQGSYQRTASRLIERGWCLTTARRL